MTTTMTTAPSAGTEPLTSPHDTSTDHNQTLFERAKALIPGGVNSPVRAFRAVGGTPRFIARAQRPTWGRRRPEASSTTSAPGAR